MLFGGKRKGKKCECIAKNGNYLCTFHENFKSDIIYITNASLQWNTQQFLEISALKDADVAGKNSLK